MGQQFILLKDELKVTQLAMEKTMLRDLLRDRV